MSLVHRLGNLARRPQLDSEIEDELQSHVDLCIDDNLARGMSPAEARRDALVRFGNRVVTKERVMGEDVTLVIESIWADLRYGVRQLLRNPGFATTAILVLALGIGASTAIFAFVDAALIKPLPYADPNRLMNVTETIPMIGRANLSWEDYKDWKRLNHTLSSLDAYTGAGFLLGAAGAEPVGGLKVTPGFFSTLAVKPLLGRDFRPEDATSGAKITILSYGAWQRRFGGRKDVLGQTVDLTGDAVAIVGVLPQSFQFVPRGDAEFWIPLQVTADSGCEKRRSCHNLIGIGRLKDGVTEGQALAEFTAIASNLERQYPDSNTGQGASVIPLAQAFTGDVRSILLALLGGAALLLVIACVNVSSLLLVRSENRRREMALRSALGASRIRLLRQFVTEGLLLVAAGGVAGLALAYSAIAVLLKLIPAERLIAMPYLQGLGLNGHALAFLGAICVLAGALFSLTPMLRLSGAGPSSGMAEGSKGSSGTLWRRFGANLVALELAVAMVLLVGAGLLGKSFYRLLHVDLGFNPEHVATLAVMLPQKQYGTDDKERAESREVMRTISNLPGVTSVGLTSDLVLNGNGNTDWIRFVGKPYDGHHNEVNQREVSGNYLSTLQARLIRGRYFTDAEDNTKPNVVVINQALADKYYPGEDPIGQHFGDTKLTPTSLKEIVGVVGNVREGELDDEIQPAIYDPFNQAPDTYMSVVVRTKGDARALLPTIVAAMHKLDPGIGMQNELTLETKIDDSPSAYLHRSAAWLVGGFAVLALVLSVVGLYGVIAYSVSQRTREIGVRMALGAARESVVRMILKDAGRLIAVGVAAGLVCSVLAATLMRKLLFGTQAWDAPTLLAVAFVLAVAALLASYFPALRAASINPTEALRAE